MIQSRGLPTMKPRRRAVGFGERWRWVEFMNREGEMSWGSAREEDEGVVVVEEEEEDDDGGGRSKIAVIGLWSDFVNARIDV